MIEIYSLKIEVLYLNKNVYPKILYSILLISSIILIVISSFYLIQHPIWDVKNWYVIAFSNSIIALVLIQMPYLIEVTLHFKLNVRQRIVYYAFILITLILGEAVGIYRMYAFYDSLVHAVGGFVLAMIGYDLFKKLSKEHNLLLMVFFLLGFQALFGTIWELFEFGLDWMIGSNTQSYRDELTHLLRVGQDALFDTMLDFTFNTLGALLFVLVFFLINKRNHEHAS